MVQSVRSSSANKGLPFANVSPFRVIVTLMTFLSILKAHQKPASAKPGVLGVVCSFCVHHLKIKPNWRVRPQGAVAQHIRTVLPDGDVEFAAQGVYIYGVRGVVHLK